MTGSGAVSEPMPRPPAGGPAGAPAIPPDGAASTASAALANYLLGLPIPVDTWREVRLEAGEVLFHAGDPGNTFYVVEAGTLEVFREDAEGRRVAIARLGPGDYVGELALLDGGMRTASVGSLGASTLRALRREDFLGQLHASPELSQAMVALLGQRLRHVLGYVDYLIGWARLVAEGDYEAAQAAIQSQTDGADGDTAQFVHTFLEMVATVQQREAQLQRELHALRIEIDRQQQLQQVAEITETDYFQSLQRQARRMRRGGQALADDEP
jgi:CRP-like cAMP-binding protein